MTQQKWLLDKKIVIVGVTTGLGLSAAQAFVEQGAKVVVVGRNPESCLLAEVHLGKSAKAMAADASQPETAVKAIALCLGEFGGFDGLYHVAGGGGRRFGDGPLHELTLEGWQKNVRLKPHFVDAFQPSGGSVIFETRQRRHHSEHGFGAGLFAFAATKSAIIGFTKSIASYYAKNNLIIKVLAPALRGRQVGTSGALNK